MKRTVTAAVAGVALAGLIGVGVAAAADGTGPAGRLADVLSGLVSKGTITEAQADAVEDALTDSWEQQRAERDADRAERRAEIDALLQNTIGMDSDAVLEAIRGGKTLKELAGDSAEELAAGMVAMVDKRLDKAVEDGRITEDQAADTLARAEERAKDWVAGEDTGMGRGMGLGLLFGPDKGPGMDRGMGRGHGGGFGHGPRDDADEATEGSGTTGSSTTSSTTWRV